MIMKRLTRNEGREGGFVLISIILFTIILEGFAAVSLIQQLQNMRMLQHNQMKTATFYAAQGVIEGGLANLADRIANFSVDEIAYDTDYTVTYADGRTNGTYRVRCAAAGSFTRLSDCPTSTVSEGGFQKLVQDFEVIASAAHPDNSELNAVFPVQATSRIHEVASLKQTSIFSYSIFYNSDLEVLPGPNMTMTGNIHANGDMYLGARSPNTLLLDSESVHATGNIYRTRKDNPADQMTGHVNIKKAGEGVYPEMTLNPLRDSTYADWTNWSTTTWNSSVQSASHNVGYVQPVTIPSIQPGGFYHTNAGLRVIYDPAVSAQPKVYQRSGGGNYTDITASLPAGTVSNKQFRNNRENSAHDVVVTEIDMTKLKDSGYFPSNGLIYATRTDAVPATGHTTDTSHGVRLVNGSQVKPDGVSGGLTVVSNNPLYVQGDFNTVNKRSVALISDALNILSNGWTDVKSYQSLNNRIPSNTTVNAGFVSGIVPTEGSDYSGGFENYPRFLEKWDSGGKIMSIGGAFINLWDSQVGTGEWVYGGNQYTAPVRQWAYDPNLQSSPPPFTPVGVEISTKTWWQEARESISL